MLIKGNSSSFWCYDFYILVFDSASQWKGHYSRCAAIDGDTGQWQMSWCPLLIITCGALTSQTIVQRGRVTAILVLNQLQQIFCLQATNYRGSHTPESRNSILRMNDTGPSVPDDKIISPYHSFLWLLRDTILKERFLPLFLQILTTPKHLFYLELILNKQIIKGRVHLKMENILIIFCNILFHLFTKELVSKWWLN